jgi:hypothetical protein
MAIVYLPLLTKDNYDAFRRILSDAPATFEEWSHLRAQQEAHYIGQRWEVIQVEVDPDQFAADCRATDSPYNLHSLDNFAFKVAQRE